MENWAQLITILVTAATIAALFLKRLDKRFDKMDLEFKEIRKDMHNMELSLQKSISRLDVKVGNIEGQITQMTRPQIMPIEKHDDLKEN